MVWFEFVDGGGVRVIKISGGEMVDEVRNSADIKFLESFLISWTDSGQIGNRVIKPHG